jgi:hypothetical protein
LGRVADDNLDVRAAPAGREVPLNSTLVNGTVAPVSDQVPFHPPR